MKQTDLEVKQQQRQKLFPKDRIAFVRSSVYEDIKTFENYNSGFISLEEAYDQIAAHNYLSGITPEQFLNERRICGWDLEYSLRRQMEMLTKGGTHASEI